MTSRAVEAPAKKPVLAMLLLVVMMFGATVCAAQQAAPATEADLHEFISEDFNEDPGDRLQLSGDTSRQERTLRLAEGSSCALDLTAGPHIDVAFSTGGTVPESLRVRVEMDGATPWALRIARADGAGSSAAGEVDIDVVDISPAGDDSDKTREVTVRVAKGVNVTGNGPWRVTYRTGLIRVEHSGQRVFVAYIDNSSTPIAAVRLEAERGEVSLSHLAIRGAKMESFSDEVKQRLAEAEASINEFMEHYRGGRYREAVAPGEKARDIFREVHGERHIDYAIAINNLGSLHQRLGDYQRAVQLSEASSRIRRELLGRDHPLYATSLNNISLLYGKIGRYEEALEAAEKALAIRGDVLGKEHPYYATTLNTVGVSYWDLGAHSRAEPLLRESVRLRGLSYGKKHPVYTTGLTNLCGLLMATGDFAGAIEVGEESVAIGREVYGPDHPSLATLLDNLGKVHRRLASYDKAEALYQEALAIRRRRLGDRHPRVATSMHNLGLLYRVKQEFSLAEPLLREAAEITAATVGREHLSYAASLDSISTLYLEQGDTIQALELMEEVLRIRQDRLSKDHSLVVGTLNNIAVMRKRLGEHETARGLLESAVEFHRERGNRIKLASMLGNLGGLLFDQGEEDAGVRMYEEALNLRRELLGPNHTDTALSLNNLGTALIDVGKFDRSRELLAEAEGIYRSHFGEQHLQVSTILGNRAQLEQLAGNATASESYIRRAIAIDRAHLERAAVIQSTRQQRTAQARHRPDLDFWIGMALAAKVPAHQIYDAVLAWKGSVTVRQKLYRDLSRNEELGSLFEQLQIETRFLSAISANIPAAAVAGATEKKKALAEEERRQWEVRFRKQTEAVESLERQIARRSADYRRLSAVHVGALAEMLPADTVLVDFLLYRHPVETSERGATNVPAEGSDSPQNPSAVGLSAEHARGGLYEPRYLAFVLVGDGNVHLIELGTADRLEKLITDFRLATQPTSSNEERATARRAADSLREVLWHPIEAVMGRPKTVIISPDSQIGSLAFAAIPGSEPNSFLLEEYRFVVVPVAQMLVEDSDEEARTPERGLLVLGDVDYGKPSGAPVAEPKKARPAWMRGMAPRDSARQWQSLAGFTDEVAIVRDRFEREFGAEVTVLRGRGASEAAFLKEAPRHYNLHVVTHGFFAGSDFQSLQAGDEGRQSVVDQYQPGLLSGLVLAGANQVATDPESRSDGILTAAEIESLPLGGVDLVVLSACETGLGAAAGGEGLLGLQRAFQVSGARSCIASLWKVDDRATLELMRRFYKYYWEDGQSRIDALRNAQLDILRNPSLVRGDVRDLKPANKTKTPRADPAHWAAFVLSGSAR